MGSGYRPRRRIVHLLGTDALVVPLYRLLAARSRLLWGDRVHGFYQVAGGLMIIAGVLIAITA